ncbi:MAG: hypothetical protein KBA28_11570 [Syntrophaceae bacterium]|nr:hypothetical protein [Syntrophaceae bacterium]
MRYFLVAAFLFLVVSSANAGPFDQIPGIGFVRSCNVTAADTGQKIKKIRYQPDEFNGAKFVDKDKMTKLLEEDGFTCGKSKIGFDKAMYDAKIFCSKPFSGREVYKWITVTFQCKGNKCDDASPYCSESKE